MFRRLKSAFGKNRNEEPAAAGDSTSVPIVESSPQGLTAEEEIVNALSNASDLPSVSIDNETSEAIERIAALLAEEPPKLKRGNPGGQEFAVKLTYNQNEWIKNTYTGYAKTHSLAPFQRVMQVFVESYIRSVEERVNPPAAEASTTEYESSTSEA